jgi:hypothetical protein
MCSKNPFFVFGKHHFLLAFSAGLLSFSLPLIKEKNALLNLFIALAVLLAYNCHHLPKLFWKNKVTTNNRKTSIFALILCVISLVGLSYLLSVLHLRLFSFYALILLAILAISYSILLGKLSIRTVPYAKAFLVSFSWTLLCCVLPMYNGGEPHWKASIFSIFFFVLAVISDFRDKKSDPISLKTIPQVLSFKVLKKLIYVLLVVFTCLNLYLFGWPFFVAAILSSIVLLYYFRQFYATSKTLYTDSSIFVFAFVSLLLQVIFTH